MQIVLIGISSSLSNYAKTTARSSTSISSLFNCVASSNSEQVELSSEITSSLLTSLSGVSSSSNSSDSKLF